MSTNCTLGARKQLHSLRLVDVVHALEKRGRTTEALNYSIILPLFLELAHGVSIDDALMMSLDEVVHLTLKPVKPLKYEGWNFWWGAAVMRDVNV